MHTTLRMCNKCQRAQTYCCVPKIHNSPGNASSIEGDPHSLCCDFRYTNTHCKPLHHYQRYESNSRMGSEETSMYDLIGRMLDYDPTFRITLKETLRHGYFDRLTHQVRGDKGAFQMCVHFSGARWESSSNEALKVRDSSNSSSSKLFLALSQEGRSQTLHIATNSQSVFFQQKVSNVNGNSNAAGIVKNNNAGSRRFGNDLDHLSRHILRLQI